MNSFTVKSDGGHKDILFAGFVLTMPEACSFRQVEEKHVSSEVQLMAWSSRMDLLALANVQGEVSGSALTLKHRKRMGA